jgi:6-phosphogluconate dehydrogenase (decarboxylating)
MQLGFVGLGRMGLNMVTRLARAGHTVVAYDRSPEAVTRAGPRAPKARPPSKRWSRCWRRRRPSG